MEKQTATVRQSCKACRFWQPSTAEIFYKDVLEPDQKEGYFDRCKRDKSIKYAHIQRLYTAPGLCGPDGEYFTKEAAWVVKLPNILRWFYIKLRNR
jgi:hypothetical protein